ncbi:MAG: MoxR family ATPase [Phycisphaerae bacterium]|nr:MoxR family ATPase [Phycisphaerae bacterium]
MTQISSGHGKAGAHAETVVDEKLMERLQNGYAELKEQIHHVIVGQDEVIDSVLSCMLAGGHCLVQGVPGLAKTLLVHSISESLNMRFNRIQFTPDLMPSDITGTDIIQEDPETHQRRYEFIKGPIFANVILADEINRTPPKTQAALLQAMQEREVTACGRTYKLEKTFFVLATENPIEQEGTYPLPEAALDRFMFMVYIWYPSETEEHQIVKQTTRGRQAAVEQVLSLEDMVAFQDVVRMAPVSDTVIAYCVRLARASRPDNEHASEMVRQYVKWGGGPRSGQFMTLGAKARALIKGRITPSFDDVRAVAPLVLRHRIITNFNAEADGVGVEKVIEDLIEKTPLPK